MLPVVLIGGAVVLGVYAWLSASENKARQDFEDSQERFNTRLKEMQKETAYARQMADESVRFQKHIALYQASIGNSKSYYQDYDHYKKLVAIIKNKRNEIGNKIGQLKAMKLSAKGQQKQIIADELSKHYGWLDEIKAELTRLYDKKSELLATLRQINQTTHDLKMTIKNTCGRGGRMWYERRFGN